MYEAYISSMNNYDKLVRNINKYTSSSDYIVNITSIQNSIIKADEKELSTIINKYTRFKNTVFNIAFFNDDAIENGYPHTVNNTIMLPVKYYFNMKQQKQRIILLIHEFIHVYQRTHPFEFNHLLIHTLGLRIDNFTDAYYKNRKRSNPDINGLLYDEGGKHRVMLYNDSPTTLADAYVYSHVYSKVLQKDNAYTRLVEKYSNLIHIQHEHPYETLACILAHVIYNDDDVTEKLRNWLMDH
jgi:hypothetical protein